MGTNWHVDALNAWTPENRNTDIPVLNTQGAYDFGGNESTYFLTSSNYLSLNNVTLGYTIPSRLTKNSASRQSAYIAPATTSHFGQNAKVLTRV